MIILVVNKSKNEKKENKTIYKYIQDNEEKIRKYNIYICI